MNRDAVVALFEKLLATNPALERKGDTMPYTSLNGHMIAVVHKDNSVALRLPPGVREQFLSTYKTTLSAQYGIVQPEYVVVPESLLGKTTELKLFLDASYAYVASMKPKPTTKGKKAVGVVKKTTKKTTKQVTKKAAKKATRKSTKPSNSKPSARRK